MSRKPRVLVPRARAAPLRRLGVAGLLLAIPVVLVVTLWPTHFLLRLKPRVVRGIEWLQARDLADWLSWTRLEVLANVAMFAPLALLLVLVLGGRRWWIALALCLTLSLGVELVQYTLPGRVASLRDVAANGAGAALGVHVAVALERLARRSTRRAPAIVASAAPQPGADHRAVKG